MNDPFELVAWVIRAPNGNVRFWTRDKDLARKNAKEWGLEAVVEQLGPRPFVPAGEAVKDALEEVCAAIPDTILHGNSFGHMGFYPHNAIKTLVAALYAGHEEPKRKLVEPVGEGEGV